MGCIQVQLCKYHTNITPNKHTIVVPSEFDKLMEIGIQCNLLFYFISTCYYHSTILVFYGVKAMYILYCHVIVH